MIDIQKKSSTFTAADVKNYGRLNISPAFSLPYMDGEYGETYWGLGIGYLFGVNLTGQHIPLFLEIGPEITWLTRTEKVDEIYYDKIYFHLLSLSSPLNISYKISLGNKNYIAPFIGLTAKFNMMATIQDEVVHSMFNKDYSEDIPNRFQLGWNTGVGFYFNRFYLGYRYSPDITSFIKEDHQSLSFDCHYINLGICF